MTCLTAVYNWVKGLTAAYIFFFAITINLSSTKIVLWRIPKRWAFSGQNNLFTQYQVEDWQNFNTSVSLLTMYRRISPHSSHLFKMIKIPASVLFYQDCFWISLWVQCLSCTAKLWACQGSYWLKSVLRLSFISSVWDVVECAFWMTYGGACELFTIKSCTCGEQGCLAMKMAFKF